MTILVTNEQYEEALRFVQSCVSRMDIMPSEHEIVTAAMKVARSIAPVAARRPKRRPRRIPIGEVKD